MKNRWIAVGAAMAFVGVALGAFGAHILKAQVPAERLDTFQTGVQYHQLHAIALVLLGLFELKRGRTRMTGAAGWLFTFGIAVFGGSLYALTVSGQRWWGAVTPFGGASFLLGWMMFTLAALKAESAA